MKNRVTLIVSQQDVYMDVHVFAEADAFLGNCISSLTAIARRLRDVRGVRTDYWGM